MRTKEMGENVGRNKKKKDMQCIAKKRNGGKPDVARETARPAQLVSPPGSLEITGLHPFPPLGEKHLACT